MTLHQHSDFNGVLQCGQDIFPAEYHIDDVSVVPVPSPVAVVGSAVAIVRRPRRRGA